MLDTLKLALRYKTNYFDAELQTYMKACKNDLMLGGITAEKINDSDESFQAVVIAYCKWQLNFQNQGDRWEKIYKSLKTAMVLDSRYQ